MVVGQTPGTGVIARRWTMLPLPRGEGWGGGTECSPPHSPIGNTDFQGSMDCGRVLPARRRRYAGGLPAWLEQTRRPAYFVSSFFAASHSKVILTSSPVERMPISVGGWMPKLVILAEVVPVNLSLSLPTRVMATGIWTLLVTPATASSPLVSNMKGASGALGASLSVISVRRYSMRG